MNHSANRTRSANDFISLLAKHYPHCVQNGTTTPMSAPIMIGNNDLVLNEATMIEALDYWLTNKVFNQDYHGMRVIGVEQRTTNVPPTFLVRMSSGMPSESLPPAFQYAKGK